jgi:hypothetical protein
MRVYNYHNNDGMRVYNYHNNDGMRVYNYHNNDDMWVYNYHNNNGMRVIIYSNAIIIMVIIYSNAIIIMVIINSHAIIIMVIAGHRQVKLLLWPSNPQLIAAPLKIQYSYFLLVFVVSMHYYNSISINIWNFYALFMAMIIWYKVCLTSINVHKKILRNSQQFFF